MTVTKPAGSSRPRPGDDLLTARFAVPAASHSEVRRPRLLRALDVDEQAPLVLVSAPAGTGKSTLVADWVRRRRSHNRTSAWVTFDPGKRDFWPAVVECLRRIGAPVPDLPEDARLGHRLGDGAVTEWAALLAGSAQRWTVVVDGYELTELEVARELDFLLRHSEGRLRLMMLSRVDPVLPLHRYRLEDALVEVRVADLAFTDDEAGALFTAGGVRLDQTTLHELNTRLGGWVAGLRFVGRALAGHHADLRQSVSTALAQAGDLNEYLLVEVLDQQSPEGRQLLLDASVPEILTPDITEAVLGPGTVRSLAELARANAFIGQIPDQPSTYRYFPFFRDLLRAQLAHESPLHSRRLHRRTAHWLRQHGLVEQAVAHLAMAGDWEEVAVTLVESMALGRLTLDGDAGFLVVGRQVPQDATGPAAAVVRAAVALASGDWAECADEVDRVDRVAELPGETGQIVRLAAVVLSAIRSSLADDAATAAARVEAAEDLLAEAPPYLRGAALAPALSFAAGRVRLREGDLEPARQALAAAAAAPLAASPLFRAGCLGHLALVEAWSGRLAAAEEEAQDALAVADQSSWTEWERLAAPHLALARVALERYQVSQARAALDEALACRTLPLDGFLGTLAEGLRAGVDRAEGRLTDARARLVRAAESAAGDEPWAAGCLMVQAAEMSVAAGHAEQALGELAAVTTRTQEVALATAAAVVEQGGGAPAETSLAEARRLATSVRGEVQLLLLEVGQHSRTRSYGAARSTLDRSLRIAAREQLRRPFREAGPSVQRIISEEPTLLRQHAWLTKPSIGASPGVQRPASRDSVATAGTSQWDRRSGSGADIVLPLTAKELEVLGLLDELLTTEEIAEKMFVSVNTIRTHIRSILRKLGVTRRNAAVRKARQLGLLTR